MIEWKMKLWRSAGAAALVGIAASCGPTEEAKTDAKAEPAIAGASGEAAIGESGGEHGEAGVEASYAGLQGDQRTALKLQQLKGFFLIAERVAPTSVDDASIVLGQGVVEVYDTAPDQFGALNADAIRAAGDPAGASAAAYTAKLRAGETAIDSARNALTINHADLAVRMTDISAGLYQHVQQDDFIDPIEYQHSQGAALAAKDALVAGRANLRATNAAAYDEAIAELDRFIALWPTVTAGETVTPYANVLAQSSRVRLALSPFL
jgi:hypothetical protein